MIIRKKRGIGIPNCPEDSLHKTQTQAASNQRCLLHSKMLQAEIKAKKDQLLAHIHGVALPQLVHVKNEHQKKQDQKETLQKKLS